MFGPLWLLVSRISVFTQPHGLGASIGVIHCSISWGSQFAGHSQQNFRFRLFWLFIIGDVVWYAPRAGADGASNGVIPCSISWGSQFAGYYQRIFAFFVSGSLLLEVWCGMPHVVVPGSPVMRLCFSFLPLFRLFCLLFFSSSFLFLEVGRRSGTCKEACGVHQIGQASKPFSRCTLLKGFQYALGACVATRFNVMAATLASNADILQFVSLLINTDCSPAPSACITRRAACLDINDRRHRHVRPWG